MMMMMIIVRIMSRSRRRSILAASSLLIIMSCCLCATNNTTNEMSSMMVDAFVSYPHYPRNKYNSDTRNKFQSKLLSKSFLQLQMIKKSNNEYNENKNQILDLDFDEEDDVTSSSIVVPKVYPQRWVQLAYLSLLALVSDWVCFSTAAAPTTFEGAFAGHSSAGLIDIFLYTNVLSCFLVTDIVARVGLGSAIKGASVLMGVGCLLRSGIGIPLVGLPSQHELVPYEFILAGTVLVGAAQPFFQCTPPMLSATWFASDERATSTATAINFNQIGIATAFLVGGNMATDAAGLANYFQLITVICVVLSAGTLLQFEDKPPSPPSSSEIEKMLKDEEEPPFIESVKKFFATPGFSKPLLAFICSISITNIVGAFIDEVLERGGIVDQLAIDLAGAGFELAILVGGIVIGGYVDRTKRYKDVTLACLLATIFFVIPLGLTDHAMGKEPFLLVAALLGLGVAAGPIQPINAELAVDVTYPSDETAVESVQQIGGNLVSALLVPIAELMSKQDYELFSRNRIFNSDLRGDAIILFAIALATMGIYSSFDAPLKRTIADCSDDGVCEAPQLNQNNVLSMVSTSSTAVNNGDGDNDADMTADMLSSLKEVTKKATND